MSYCDRFKKFYEDMYGPLVDDDYLLSESYSIDEDDMRLGALGAFYVSEATKADPEIEVDSALEMDYAEHKNHYVTIYSNVQMGGRQFRVVLDETEYINGRIAKTPEEFNDDSAEAIKRIIRDYHHVLNHVNPNLDRNAYSTMEDPHEC